ncbi:hypothetical protein [Streptomyces kanamyceticus]|uniref:Type I restriction modification DNA specificity domain-containing protein n=1 Tax=Streptomyces kanamyceticus TaxID=1967 RepID=A0A5J6GSC2_STRKN|nr:hypothetical protein [Streptomyces kanamyceticus]QEU95886.1 hypothetical protein CP970_37590 [Streptomyces kanamyceticus]
MSRYPQRELGEVLYEDAQMVTLEDDSKYAITGIYSFGRGLIERPRIMGGETAYERMARIRTNQVVMSKLNAWEGALAVVDPRFNETYASPEYPVFSVDNAHADPRYIKHLIAWPELWERLTPRGSMVRRKRTTPRTFLATEVPLPDLAEQGRIADKLDAMLATVATTATAAPQQESARLLAIGGLDRALTRWSQGTVRVDATCKQINDTVHPGDDPSPAKEFVGLEHIAPHFGQRIGARPLGDEKGRKFRFQPGDVLYGYLRPYLNKVWVADRHGLCSVEQYVLRPNGHMPAELIAAGLRAKATLDTVKEHTHNLQLPRLRSGLLMAMEIPDIPQEHHEAALLNVRAWEQKAHALNSLQRQRDDLLATLGPTLLNAAFSGQL